MEFCGYKCGLDSPVPDHACLLYGAVKLGCRNTENLQLPQENNVQWRRGRDARAFSLRTWRVFLTTNFPYQRLDHHLRRWHGHVAVS